MEQAKPQVSIRSILLILLFLGFTWLVVSRLANLRDTLAQLGQGDLAWIILSVLLHIGYFYANAVLYRLCFDVVGVRLRSLELFPVLLAGLFVNAVAPAGGVGAAALFVDYGSRQGNQGSRLTIGVLLSLIADLMTLIPFVLAGIFYLLSKRHLRVYEWIAFLFFTIFIVGLSCLLYLAHKKPDWTRSFLGWLRRLANRFGKLFKRPELIKESWVEETAGELREAFETIAQGRGGLVKAFTWGSFMHVINLFGLYTFFRAYHQPVNFGTIDAAFSLGIVFFVVAVIPQGVGAVEGIMSLILIDMGIPRTTAVVIALAFRGVNFWLPLLAGFISYEVLFARPASKREQA